MFSILGRFALWNAAVISAAIVLTRPAFAAWELDMPVGKTVLAPQILELHHLILIICTVACIFIFGFAFYTIATCRKSQGAKAATFTHSVMAESIWTIIPTLILILIAIPTARSIIAIEDTSNPDLSIKITGYQWKWSYDYLDKDKFFFSSLDRASSLAAQENSGIDPFTVKNYLRNVDKPMVVPVNKRVRLLLTANDVIHSWWVPELYVKKDANPGYINESWFEATETGVFRGGCTELCGRGHGFMPIVVVVETQERYEQWLAGELTWDPELQQMLAMNAPADKETIVVSLSASSFVKEESNDE